MPRTLLICSPTASVAGGIQTWMRELSARLDRSRWRLLVALLRGAVAHDPRRFREANPELDTIEVDGRGLDARGRVRAVRRCIRHVRPDVFLPLTAIDGHNAVCAAKQDGESVRYLMSIRGNIPAQIADARERVDFADLAVCPGRLTCRLLEWAGMPAERIRHVPNGARAAATGREARAKQEPIRLGYVGRLSRADKRVMDLVGFSRALTEKGVPHTLCIAGDGPVRAELEQALAGRAEFLGRLDVDTLYERVYPRLDVFLLFSESEAFGIAAVEAMQHGVVPVTSRFIGHGAEGFLRDGETALLFPVGDTEAAAARVQALATDPQLLERLSQAARHDVELRYRWSACIAGWVSALDEMMALPARTGIRVPRIEAGPSRLRAIGVPPAMVDALRRARLRIAGVPAGLRGGEEWPWIGRHHDESTLRQIEDESRRRDYLMSTSIEEGFRPASGRFP